jgi:hypothetical protein
VTAGMRDNPHIDAESVIASLGHLSAMERKAIIDGLFVHFAGAVVNVTPDHVVPALSPDYLRGKDVYIGIDPGVRRAGVLWVVFDRDNRMTAFDELYPDNATVETMVRDIRHKNHEWGIKQPTYIIDPSARNRSLTNAQSVESEFARNGIYCCHGQNDRRAGILQLRGRLGEPRPRDSGELLEPSVGEPTLARGNGRGYVRAARQSQGRGGDVRDDRPGPSLGPVPVHRAGASLVFAGDDTEDQAVEVRGARVRRSGAVASRAGGFGPADGGDELSEEEYIAFWSTSCGS